MTAACTHRACPQPAVRAVTNAAGATWHGCHAHWPAMADALHYGQSMDSNVTTTETGAPST